MVFQTDDALVFYRLKDTAPFDELEVGDLVIYHERMPVGSEYTVGECVHAALFLPHAVFSLLSPVFPAGFLLVSSFLHPRFFTSSATPVVVPLPSVIREKRDPAAPDAAYTIPALSSCQSNPPRIRSSLITSGLFFNHSSNLSSTSGVAALIFPSPVFNQLTLT